MNKIIGIVGFSVVIAIFIGFLALVFLAEKTIEVESVGWVNGDNSVECQYNLPVGLAEAVVKSGKSSDYYGQILRGWVPNESVRKKILNMREAGNLVWIETPEPGRPRAWIVLKRGNEKLPEFIREK